MADQHRAGAVGSSRDLLRHFALAGGAPAAAGAAGDDGSPTGEEDSGEIELSLGLSLGGSFGVDPSRGKQRLVRSSSSNVAYALAPSLPARDVEEEEEERRRRQALVRTCSLPVAADEEDDRKRRAGLVLGRGEAKRRKDGPEGWGFAARPWPPAGVLPQQPANTAGNNGADGGLPQFMGKSGGVMSFGNGQGAQGETQGQGQPPPAQGLGQRPQFQAPPQHTQPPPPRPTLAQAAAAAAAQGSRGGIVIPQLASQGSLGSQGSSLTANTPDSDSRPSTQGYGHRVNSRDLSTVQPSTNRSTEQAASIYPGSSVASNNSGQAGENPAGSSRSNGSLEADRAIGDQMPHVFTKGDGPNGRIIEGFLYKYKKVEEVRIVCVCHGIFLTPAEFIKHAGGGDVAHPLRHIVVKPSASFL